MLLVEGETTNAGSLMLLLIVSEKLELLDQIYSLLVPKELAKINNVFVSEHKSCVVWK